MTEPLRTPTDQHRLEPPPIKGSRFVATLAPAATRDEAQAVVARVAVESADARHVCWAFRLGGEGQDALSSDAGEPSGSAGRPILAQLEGHGVTNAVLVVARWFGGVKLGVGGLMRAYGGAAGRCLDRAALAPHVPTVEVVIEHPWELTGPVAGVLAAEGLEPARAEYGERVRLAVAVPREALERVRSELRDRTGGRVELSAGAAPRPAPRPRLE